MISKKVFKAGIGYIVGGILIKGIAFITTPIFTRLLTTEEYGILNTYLSYEAILAMVVGFQFAASIKSANIEFSGKGNSLIQYVRNAIILVSLQSLFVLIIGNVFCQQLLKLTGFSSRLLLNLLVMNAFGNAILTIYNSFVSISYSYKKYIVVAAVNAILNILISLLLIHTIMRNNASFGRILGYVIPYCLIAVYIIFSVFKGASARSMLRKSYTSFAYKYCTPLIPNGFSEVMLGQFGKLTVDNNLGSSAMGIYSLSYSVYSIIGIVRIAMDYVVGPFFFEKRKDNDFAEIKKFSCIYSRMLVIVSTCIMLFTPEIVKILGAPEYFAARFTSIPLVGASYFVFLVSIISQEEYYSKKTFLVSAASVITMVLNIVSNILIVPVVGEMGAAVITMASYFLMICIHFIFIAFVLKSPVFNWKLLAVDCSAIILMTIVSELIIDMSIIRYLILLLFIVYGAFHFRKVLRFVGGN